VVASVAAFSSSGGGMFRMGQVPIEQQYHRLCSSACILYFLLLGAVCKSQLLYPWSMDRKLQGLCALVDRRARGIFTLQAPDKVFAQGLLI